MYIEEDIPEEDTAMNEDHDELESLDDPIERLWKLSKTNRDAAIKFLGEGPHCVEVCETEWYYWELLAWTVKCIASSPGWKIAAVSGYSRRQPIYRNIQIDHEEFQSCLVDGQMLMESGNIRLVITPAEGLMW